ncbi:hypothetical protein C7T94_15465 [Pedobacter yulinensis]|uniref:Uncharacterized protein n=1 Tax=Pedobacter yulinensis TaxID=2126353 RepID=A0A2T3HID7_9SPHI|nr:hypothetical protein [Pedobacter yulinensis]PST82197.1 hypothetical protein C7T94_15465 [Pedobacter yulinensis]
MTAKEDNEKNPRNAEVELTEEQKKADKDGNQGDSEISTDQEKPESDIAEKGDKFDQAVNPDT